MAALFMVAKCPSIEDWIKKMQYIYTMGHYSAMRKDETLPFVTTWILRLSCWDKNAMVTLVWDIKPKAMNQQTKETKLINTTARRLPEGKEGQRSMKRVKGSNTW